MPDRCRGLEAEDFNLFEIRLAADTLQRPDWYYQRRPIPRLDHELIEFVGELWDVSKIDPRGQEQRQALQELSGRA